MGGKRRRHLLLVALLLVCAGSSGPNADVAGTADGAPVAGRVVLTAGHVRFAGEPPEGAVIDMSADPYCVDLYDEPVWDRPVLTGPDGGLTGVLVRVLNAPAAGDVPESEVLLDQVGCLYTPEVVAVRAGQPLVIRNGDARLHNVRVSPAANPGFNLGQPMRGMQSTRSFDTPEIGIEVRCDIHGWMRSSIHVLEHEFFDITGEDGTFALPELPPGDYEIEAWHPTLGAVRAQVSVDAAGAPPVTLEFVPAP